MKNWTFSLFGFERTEDCWGVWVCCLCNWDKCSKSFVLVGNYEGQFTIELFGNRWGW